MNTEMEAFEAWYFNENYKGTTACKLKVFEVLSGLVGVESPYNGTYLISNVQASWKAWQAAKAQAVPEGFVVVPMKATEKMVDAACDFTEEDEAWSFYDIYEAMIAAVQEPSDV